MMIKYVDHRTPISETCLEVHLVRKLSDDNLRKEISNYAEIKYFLVTYINRILYYFIHLDKDLSKSNNLQNY